MTSGFFAVWKRKNGIGASFSAGTVLFLRFPDYILDRMSITSWTDLISLA